MGANLTIYRVLAPFLSIRNSVRYDTNVTETKNFLLPHERRTNSKILHFMTHSL